MFIQSQTIVATLNKRWNTGPTEQRRTELYTFKILFIGPMVGWRPGRAGCRQGRSESLRSVVPVFETGRAMTSEYLMSEYACTVVQWWDLTGLLWTLCFITIIDISFIMSELHNVNTVEYCVNILYINIVFRTIHTLLIYILRLYVIVGMLWEVEG